MSPNHLSTFLTAIERCPTLPPAAKDNAQRVTGLDVTEFDQSYLDFLDQQIELCPRGPEWNERLDRRRDALAAYCNRPLISGRIASAHGEYWIKVDPARGVVVHWEAYTD